MHPWCVSSSSCDALLSGAHAVATRFDGGDDVLVARAAADIAFEQLADLGIGGLRLLAAQIHRTHHHAGRAEAALQAMALLEGRLHGVHGSVGSGHALYGLHLGALGLHGQHGAGLDGLAIDQHRAGSALAGIAAHMGARQAQLFTQRLHQQGIGGTSMLAARPLTVN
jgi:hypothetical protein